MVDKLLRILQIGLFMKITCAKVFFLFKVSGSAVENVGLTCKTCVTWDMRCDLVLFVACSDSAQPRKQSVIT